jgi:hypothetical protein
LIAGINQTLAEERSVLPEYSGEKLWLKYGDFITFFSQPVPQQDKLQENWAIVRFP